MHDDYLTQPAAILQITKEAFNVNTYRIALNNDRAQKNLEFTAGQFFMLGIPGLGEAPISISSSLQLKDYFELTIRSTGRITDYLAKLKKGSAVTIRGPYGRGWPKINLDDEVALIAGGIGLPAVKPLLDDYCHGYLHCQKLQLFFGTTSFEKLVCVRYYQLWEKEAKLFLTLNEKSPKWKYHIGQITELIRTAKFSQRTKFFIVGPPIMYKFVLAELAAKKIKDTQIFLSLERRMHCGFGVCQHCAVGEYYVCKDGPVFRYDKIKSIPGAL